MCTVLQPPSGYPIAVNKYIISYEGCPESIQLFWISEEPVAWPWCNLAASQRRPYCVSVNSHSPVGLVSRQWEANNLAASQRRPYCLSVNSHSPVGLVSQQWDASNLVASQRRPYCVSVNSHSPVGLVSRQWDASNLVASQRRPYCVSVKSLFRGASQSAVRRQ